MSFPSYFRPNATEDLIRVGSAGDGGYVMPERILDSTNGLLSMGLCDDWTFEEDIFQRTSAPIIVFDHSIDRRFWTRRFLACNIRGLMRMDPALLRRAWRFFDYRKFFNATDKRHVKLAIGREEHGMINLPEALKMSGFENNILMKIDIEGAEYRILDQIVANRSRLTGIVMELHEIDIHDEKIERFLTDMGQDFTLVHFHANNCTTFGPPDMSIVVEISLMNSALLKPGEELRPRALPIPGLDAKNLPNAPDIEVKFA